MYVDFKVGSKEYDLRFVQAVKFRARERTAERPSIIPNDLLFLEGTESYMRRLPDFLE
jgi:hypothetical protein